MHTINNSFLSCACEWMSIFVCVSPFIPFTSCWGFFLWYFMTALWCVLVFPFLVSCHAVFFSFVVAAAAFLFFRRHRIFIQFEKLCFVVNLRMCHNFCLLRFMAAHWICVSVCVNIIWSYMQRHTSTIEPFSTFQRWYTWSAFPCSYSLIRSFHSGCPCVINVYICFATMQHSQHTLSMSHITS